jgi:hypothetical protein
LSGSGETIEAKIVWNIIPEFTAKMNAEADAVRERALERIAEEARSRVRVDTGATQASIEVQGDTVQAGEAALFLEYGTVNMPAYPFLGPAATAVQASFAAEFAAMFELDSLV